ncbi:MAG: hypothetical protein AABY40_02365 [Nanoarchaeota archaeon]
MKKRHSNTDTRGAIGLSVETLVVVIISLVILSGGITLIYQFISGAEEIKGQLDSKTQDELERLLVGQGKKVALPLHVATIPRGDSHIFGLGILNTYDAVENFQIRIRFIKVTDDTNVDITSQVNALNIAAWALFNTVPVAIESNANDKEAILIQVPKDALKGEYVFVAEVFDSKNNQYGNPQTFIVNVV